MHSSKTEKTVRKTLRKSNKDKGRNIFLDYLFRFPFPYILIFIIVFLVYGQALSFFLGKFDEELIVLGNLDFLMDFGNLKAAFFKDAFFSDKGVNFYRPLQNILFMVDAHLFGPPSWGFYLMNIVVHGITCCLLFYLMTLFLKDPPTAFLLSLVFAVNPLFVHAIAWAPALGDLLIGMFGVLSFIFFIKYIRSKDLKFLIFNVIAFHLAILSKETAILIPFIFLFYYFFNEKDKRVSIPGLIIPLILYFICIVVYLYFRGQVVKIGATKEEFGLLPLIHNLRTIPEYIAKFFIPFKLAPMSGFSILNTCAGLLILAILTGLSFKNKPTSSRFYLFGLFWFLLFSIPGLMYTHEQGSAAYDYLEHRAYLPMMGIMIFVFFLLNAMEKTKRAGYIPVCLLLLAMIYGIYAYLYTKNYENPLTFYNLATRANPNSAMAYSNRGLVKVGIKDYEGAMKDYAQALTLKPDYAQVHVNRGVCKFQMNDKEGALIEYQHAVALKPGLFQAHYNIANIKNEMGLKTEALKEYDVAMKLYPTYYPGYLSRGILKYQMNDNKAAIEDLTRAIQLNAKYTEAYLNRGKILFLTNEKKEACNDWKSAARLGNKEAENLLGQYCRE